MKVKISHPDEGELKNMKVFRWPVWEKEISEFDWFYDTTELFYVLEGKVEIRYGDNKKVMIKSGDLVTCPAGMNCRWKIIEPIRKHYTFIE